MKTTQLFLASFSLLFASALSAQTSSATKSPALTSGATRAALSEYGARATDWEFTLGGSGASNKDFDNSLGGVNFSVGNYLTDSLEISVRQSVNYSNGTGGSGATYDASTFVALDQHFGSSGCVPLSA